MKYLLVLLILTFCKLSYSQDSIFGVYEIGTSILGEKTNGTILHLNCDYTYFRSDSVSKDWGKWELKDNDIFLLHVDSMHANGHTEKSKVKVYYRIINNQLKLDEREYSKAAFKKEIEEINESAKANNLRFRYRYSEEAYKKSRESSMSLYFEKKISITCH